MIVPVSPPLDGLAAERFLAFAKQLERSQQRKLSFELDELCELEAYWARTNPYLDGTREVYEAAVRVLTDLARTSWSIHQQGYEIELRSKPFRPDRNLTPEEVAQTKRTVQQELLPQRHEQLNDPRTRAFIKRVETPSLKSGTRSIRCLIADGHELYKRLSPAINAQGQERLCLLTKAIRPYLQLVPAEEEAGKPDEFTNLPLLDIWRYFRLTWAVPDRKNPGRKMQYLIRDKAHPNHAVIGIAALSNSAIRMGGRDEFIGWSFDSWSEAVHSAVGAKRPDRLGHILDKLEIFIGEAIEDIETEGLVTPSELEKPTLEIVARLRRTSGEFAHIREEALRDVSARDGDILGYEEFEGGDLDIPPVSDDMLALEGKKIKSEAERTARKALVAKKRAASLAILLKARFYFIFFRPQFVDLRTTMSVMRREEFRVAVGAAITANKGLKAGTNMLEITTCGAVQPYSRILGGKLVALLMLSPQVAADYQWRYSQRASIIGSQMKNSEVRRDATIAYLGTTSLYAYGTSQYNRLELPQGIISPDQPRIRYTKVGYTSGYGTIQFSPATARAVERVLESILGYQSVNGVFGEGPSPKLRKMQAGLDALGFSPESLLRHNQHRLIYSMLLFDESLAFLRGEDVTLPGYVRDPERYRSATRRIAKFWRERWLSRRIDQEQVVRELQMSGSWSVSDQLPALGDESTNSSQKANMTVTNTSSDDFSNPELKFWRSLASAGPNVCSDELSAADLERLNVKLPVEDFILDKVREGFSLVLTGNAGDGKTHLLRRIEPQLQYHGAVVETDATAVMRHGDIRPIIDKWKSALNAKRPFCLAANEYPLYELRTRGQADLPILQEVDRQCRYRLAYGDATSSEDSFDKVLVVDLSLRNPLASEFARAALLKILNDASIKKYAESGSDQALQMNYQSLTSTLVQDRLAELYRRLVVRGYRAPIRELWIQLARMLFGASSSGAPKRYSHEEWYSQRLFRADPRFALSKLMREYCDPAQYSHPQWDLLLESPGATDPTDWRIRGSEPIYSLNRNASGPRFDAMKRIFYFEHESGQKAFELEDTTAQEFQSVLKAAAKPDETLTKYIVEAINLCYCQRRFNGMKDALYLWIGHRFHEKPTRSYLANQSIPSSQFKICVPHIPKRVAGALVYEPDHFLLQYEHLGKVVKLAVDYSLYDTLHKLGNGLPRHLVPDRNINRLDTFVEKLHTLDIPQQRVFNVFNAETRTATEIRLSADYYSYEGVSTHE